MQIKEQNRLSIITQTIMVILFSSTWIHVIKYTQYRSIMSSLVLGVFIAAVSAIGNVGWQRKLIMLIFLAVIAFIAIAINAGIFGYID